MKKHLHKRKATPEEPLYRSIEAHMPPLDYERIRPHVERSASDDGSSRSSVRCRWAPALTAVAATLSVACLVTVSGLWISDRGHRPTVEPPPETSPSAVPVPDSEKEGPTTPDESTEPAQSVTAEPSVTESAPMGAPLDTEAETLPSSELPPETAPFSVPSPETLPETTNLAILSAAPDEVVIDGITYRKTRTCLDAPEVGGLIESKQGPDNHLLSIACHSVIGESHREQVAVLFEHTYILYIVESFETEEREKGSIP